MYLHIGETTMLQYREIIGIFDLDVMTVTAGGREYIRRVQKEGKLVSISENLPKSVIVTDDKVYISPISTATLKMRVFKTCSHANLFWD